jgi:hypothetical protein
MDFREIFSQLSSELRQYNSPGRLKNMQMGETIERSSTRRLSHLSVRLLAAINLADAAIQVFSPRYAHAVANGPMADVLVRWLVLSSFLLPA